MFSNLQLHYASLVAPFLDFDDNDEGHVTTEGEELQTSLEDDVDVKGYKAVVL